MRVKMKMEEGSSNREESRGDKGAGGWVVGVIHWNGSLKSAGGGLGWPEDREEGT